ncbi:dinuclear metal center YbgI/SA1388 family protein [Cryobacterium mesophilum]|uniref:GTP cyclohydrolase 1 type 2 homolog n=1 Tax=Terrimesophilobacter mesophilus TaxID=433647 RepID=A0A4R8V8T7_9MICO|nr:Nif3-like dinuclear metal center hexameric protein [Terrimesophilobacter mesophilus]MBB5631797.1 dinuclear metal center YbgI/SA1388 family protein [Terrimesophilobacter mesophilus]TFB78716.1 Nif3-like dinuclear metal center hexameric protein [Terrimesophilobacter mesophilus]
MSEKAAGDITVSDLVRIAGQLWPLSGAEPWDSVGLVSGDLQAAVTGIHLTVDAVPDTADEAIELGAEVLLAHHPLLLRGVTSVAEDRFKGAVVSRLIRGGCALYTAHTNADVVESGTSAVLAGRLGLTDIVPIVEAADGHGGVGRVGTLARPMTLGRLARRLAEFLPPTASGVRVSGDYDAEISRVAVCAGAGDNYLDEAEVQASDVFITSDLRHHPASAFRETARLTGGPALIDVSHWASEWLWLDSAAAELRTALPGVTVTVSELRTDPWDFVIVQ